MAKEIYAGIDLHKNQFTACILKDGEVMEDGTKYPISSEGFSSFSSRLQQLTGKNGTVKVAFESTGNARYFKTEMNRRNFESHVINTLRFKVVNLSTNKTDKNDSRTIADFLEKDMLPESHLCSAYSESIRRILKVRSLLVSDCTAIKNQAHAVLLAYGIITQVSQFQSRKARVRFVDRLSNHALKQSLTMLFKTLDSLESQIKSLEHDLTDLTIQDNNVRLLKTIPGIGIVNACTISAYTDDIRRFENAKQYSSFCGIVPWVQSSNESAYYGRITKRGPKELRTALVQCVVAMVRLQETTGNTRLMKSYQILKDSKCSGKAIIATARKLSCIIYTMLSKGKPFDMSMQL
ncbi:MAG: IS110 family transposase [Sphaerochaetaceae bacterium]|nr:IS110 family transposase [Sphaerochaetaceae bacterium]